MFLALRLLTHVLTYDLQVMGCLNVLILGRRIVFVIPSYSECLPPGRRYV